MFSKTTEINGALLQNYKPELMVLIMTFLIFSISTNDLIVLKFSTIVISKAVQSNTLKHFQTRDF